MSSVKNASKQNKNIKAKSSEEPFVSEFTEDVHNQFKESLPFDEDQQDFKDAERGFLLELSPRTIYKTKEDETKTVVWDLEQYAFQMKDKDGNYPTCPPTVNPSLWRNAILNSITGVFKVTDHIYQVRGYDLTNMSAVKGDSGWIIIDPLTTEETASAALQNLNQAYIKEGKERGETRAALAVSTVIFTHSHVDHFGGVWGLFDNYEKNGATIYAPEGFLEEAVSENVIAGNVMTRRSIYMYGRNLPIGPAGQVDNGLGKGVATGTSGLAKPDVVIEGLEMVKYDGKDNDKVDGVEIWFQNVPGSEAPAEMMFYFPEFKTLCAAEDVTHTFHNVLTLRGAKVRDPLKWASYLNDTLEWFPDAEILFATHHWPTWNKDEAGKLLTQPGEDTRVVDMIKKQRDLYKYIHDQSVRLTNQGYTIQEVGEMLKLPDSLGKKWFNRDYYGTVNHNAKAIYQNYIGWFDANPASLHQLPPEDAAKCYLKYMGNLEDIVKQAETDYENGQYRSVAMILNQVVFGTEREYQERTLSEEDRYYRRTAVELLALSYDQLAYQSESAPWRNFYLTGASELRTENDAFPTGPVNIISAPIAEAMELNMICDYLCIHINAEKAAQLKQSFIVLVLDDEGKQTDSMDWTLENSVMNYRIKEPRTIPDLQNTILPPGVPECLPDPDAYSDLATAAFSIERKDLNRIITGDTTGKALMEEGKITISGMVGSNAEEELNTFFSLQESFNFFFRIVTPNI